jgi:hypothetical protein
MVLAQNTLVMHAPSSQNLLSLNMKNIDVLFPGFAPGDFAIIHGLPYVLTLSLLIAVRSQLPYQLGGLESSTVFVDGGNTYRLYKVSRLARLHNLRPREVLQRIFISRAFTMYQLTSIILDGLEAAINRFTAKLVILSDFEELYLDKDIPPDESKEVFSQVVNHISALAKKQRVTVVATCPPHHYSRRQAFLHTVACAKSNVTIAVTKKPTFPHGKQFSLEKHSVFKPGSVAFPSRNLTLNDFT